MEGSSGPYQPTQSSKTRKRRDNESVGPIKNITISDARTGFVVIERVYRWPEQAVTTNLGSLIQSFYQFAREVDDGEIVSVNFEEHKGTGKPRNRNSTGSGGRSHQKHVDTMKMVCRRNEKFVVSVFYDMKGMSFIPAGGPREDLAELLHQLEVEFDIHCGGIHESLQSKIAGLVDSIDDNVSELSEEIRSQFNHFKPTIDKIMQGCFPAIS
mmetsp:Transcript_16629/g.25026  ORF Transcript_16629/g.25026 Transcript_16629/m.25026 type:complete len:212 (-) Transcript_16629:252-887(-)